MTQPSPLDVCRIEAAASHQARALAWFRQAQDASTRMSAARRRCLQLRALEHLLHAPRLLEEIQHSASAQDSLPSTLDQHLARLDQMIGSVETLVDAQATSQEQT